MNKMHVSLASFAAALMAATFASTSARADEPAPAPAPPVAAPAPQDRSVDEPAKSFKSFALEANPLAAAIGRYSIQAEWLPAEHHALVLNPHFDHISYDLTVTEGGQSRTVPGESMTGFGGELGYRFYTGERGANGFYVGPSLIVATYTDSAEGGASQSFTNIGAAIDIGGQAIVGPGIVIGGGFGLQYTKSSLDLSTTDGLPLGAAIVAGGGLRPRALLTVGYAF